jgi:hypothetical protein
VHKIEGNKLITTTKTKTTITFKKKKKKTMWTRTTGKIMIMDVDNEPTVRESERASEAGASFKKI